MASAFFPAVVVGADAQEAVVLVGHGGSSTIDGHAKRVSSDGEVLWTATLGNPGIQPEGVAAHDNAVVVACGSGIEGCDAVEATAAERAQCQTDPRRAWRSHLVGLSTQGDVLWSRTESLMDTSGEALESASEFVAVSSDGDVSSVVDHDLGVGLARLAE
jgi:hypothetical protein